MASIYDYLDYQDYLNAWIIDQAKGGHGVRRKMADHLACQSAFISQVLHKTAHLSVEHGYKLNTFLNHTQDEAEYFMQLLLYQKSGSKDLQAYFKAKIDAVQKNRLILKNRIQGAKTLSESDQARYYSAWYYGAIRLLVSIPGFESRDQIAERLRLPPRQVSLAIEFLLRTKLLTEKSGRLVQGEMHLHLENDSPLIARHHTNWRLKALEAVTAEQDSDLHYSLALTLSQKDVLKIKSKLVEFIAEVQNLVRPSAEEELCGFCLDWFKI